MIIQLTIQMSYSLIFKIFPRYNSTKSKELMKMCLICKVHINVP